VQCRESVVCAIEPVVVVVNLTVLATLSVVQFCLLLPLCSLSGLIVLLAPSFHSPHPISPAPAVVAKHPMRTLWYVSICVYTV
jgi:hypothetical protein